MSLEPGCEGNFVCRVGERPGKACDASFSVLWEECMDMPTPSGSTHLSTALLHWSWCLEHLEERHCNSWLAVQ